MTDKLFFASLTRITDLQTVPFETALLPMDQWACGDYVLGRVNRPPRGYRAIELTTGRMAEVVEGNTAIGAFGDRHATLEAVGTWRMIGSDLQMHALTSGGLFGKVTSGSRVLPPLLDMDYEGHVMRNSQKVNMAQFVPPAPATNYACPTILVVGTSMSAGKTASAKVIIRELKRRGLRVVGCKLSGAGRYRDILGMLDAGADAIFDFVDVGLPSSVVRRDDFIPVLDNLLARIAETEPDVVVAEAGASPLEPYNGDVVVERLRDQIKCTVLCASDPYAVVGVMQGYGMRPGMEPDLVAGIATSTSAGIELIEKLTACSAINMLDPDSLPLLRNVLFERLKA